MNIEFIETDQRGLEEIIPLWRKLNEHHRVRSPYFPGHYKKMTWQKRKDALLDKSIDGLMHVILAKDKTTGSIIGYCVSTISKKKEGDVDSIYIDEGYRKHGIGDMLIIKAMHWMDSHSIDNRMIEVAAGNEEVFSFYSRHNFLPRSIILSYCRDNRPGKSVKSDHV